MHKRAEAAPPLPPPSPPPPRERRQSLSLFAREPYSMYHHRGRRGEMLFVNRENWKKSFLFFLSLSLLKCCCRFSPPPLPRCCRFPPNPRFDPTSLARSLSRIGSDAGRACARTRERGGAVVGGTRTTKKEGEESERASGRSAVFLLLLLRGAKVFYR